MLLLIQMPVLTKIRFLFSLLFCLGIQGKYVWFVDEIYVFYILWVVPILVPSIFIFQLLNTSSYALLRPAIVRSSAWILVVPTLANLLVLKLYPQLSAMTYILIQFVLLFSTLSNIEQSKGYKLVDCVYSLSLFGITPLFGYCYYKLDGLDRNYHSAINYYGICITVYIWISWYLVPLLCNQVLRKNKFGWLT